MGQAIESILNRFFGKSRKPAARSRSQSVPHQTEPERPQVLGSTECLLVEPLGADRAAVLQALARTGMKVREVSSIEAADFAGRRPDLVISNFDHPAGMSDAMRRLASISYDGIVQPLGRGQGAAAFTQNDPGGPRVLPPLPAPIIPETLLEVIETEGLARTAGGHVSVSLSTALANKWMSFVYQPKIALRSMKLAGAETFARVEHPVHGTLLPSAFLPHSRAQDLHALGLASIKAALNSWTPFYRLGFNLVLSVNIPLEALEAEELFDLVQTHRPQDKRWPGLIVEVEAADTLAAIHEVGDFARKMRKADVHMGLDNFGLGATMTTDLTEIGATEIKLHPNVGQGASKNPARAACCRAAVELARAYKASVSCNSIETLADVTFLRNLGCDSAQGLVFADALDRVHFASLLRSKVAARAAS